MPAITIHNYEAFLLDYFEGTLDPLMVEELRRFVVQHPELELDLSDDELPVIAPSSLKADFKESLKKQEEALEDEEILNYLENLLPENERRAFEERLNADKTLFQRWQAYQKTMLPQEPELQYTAKAGLYRNEDDLVLNNELIAYLEGTLSTAERKGLEVSLKQDVLLRKELELLKATRLTADTGVVYPNKAELKKQAKVLVLFSRTRVIRAAAGLLLLACLGFLYNQMQDTQPTETPALAQNSAKKSMPEMRAPKSDNTENIAVSPQETLVAVDKQHRQETKQQEHLPMFATQTDLEKGKEEHSREVPPTPALEQGPVETIGTELAEHKVEKAESVQVLATDSTKPVTHKYTELALVEEMEEGDVPSNSAKREKGLWKKAVQLARQVNKLGVKSVDGVEDARQDRYRISFNSFSVEKK